MSDEPLIYTTMGNVPVKSLRYSCAWNLDRAEQILRFEEFYHDADGRMVRHDVHKLGLKPLESMHVTQGSIN